MSSEAENQFEKLKITLCPPRNILEVLCGIALSVQVSLSQCEGDKTNQFVHLSLEVFVSVHLSRVSSSIS